MQKHAIDSREARKTAREELNYIPEHGSHPRELFAFVDRELSKIARLVGDIWKGESNPSIATRSVQHRVEILRKRLKSIEPVEAGGRLDQTRLGEAALVDFIVSAFEGVSTRGAVRIVVTMRHWVQEMLGRFELGEKTEEEKFVDDVEALYKRVRRLRAGSSLAGS